MFKSQVNYGAYSVPSNMMIEKETNVFMRCKHEKLQQAIGIYNPVELMYYLVKWKKTGERPYLVSKPSKKYFMTQNE